MSTLHVMKLPDVRVEYFARNTIRICVPDSVRLKWGVPYGDLQDSNFEVTSYRKSEIRPAVAKKKHIRYERGIIEWAQSEYHPSQDEAANSWYHAHATKLVVLEDFGI